MLLSLILSTGLVSQPLQARRGELDPFLWASIRDTVEQAAEAEADPKRGAANAMEILRARRAEINDRNTQIALDLRLAATLLRDRFRTSTKFSVPMRRAQSLSTYARLDLTEPGLSDLLKDCLKEETLSIRVAALGRSPKLDLSTFRKELDLAFAKLPVTLEWVDPGQAEFRLKVQVSVLETDPPQRLTRLDVEHIEDGKVAEQRALYRSSALSDEAEQQQFRWLARIGGRDLLFQFLREGPIPDLATLYAPPSGDGHHHHHHGHEH